MTCAAICRRQADSRQAFDVRRDDHLPPLRHRGEHPSQAVNLARGHSLNRIVDNHEAERRFRQQYPRQNRLSASKWSSPFAPEGAPTTEPAYPDRTAASMSQRLSQRPCFKFQHCTHLFLVYARKPLHEFVDCGRASEILEQAVHGYSCSGECPSSADLLGASFHCWASAPVHHTVSSSSSIVYSWADSSAFAGTRSSSNRSAAPPASRFRAPKL